MVFQHPKKKGGGGGNPFFGPVLCMFWACNGPIQAQNMHNKTQIVSGHHQTHLGWEIGQSGKEEAGPI